MMQRTSPSGRRANSANTTDSLRDNPVPSGQDPTSFRIAFASGSVNVNRDPTIVPTPFLRAAATIRRRDTPNKDASSVGELVFIMHSLSFLPDQQARRVASWADHVGVLPGPRRRSRASGPL